MNAYVTIGLFFSMAIHTSALLLFNQHALQRMDALPETRIFTVELFSFEAPLKKQTNQFFSLGKTLDKDLSEKWRPENSDLSERTNHVRHINKISPVATKISSKPVRFLQEEFESLPMDPSQKTKTKNAKLTHEKQRQTRQKRQSLTGKQRLKQVEDMRSESAPSKSRIVSAQPAAVIKTRPSGFASNLPPIYPNLARRRGIQGTVVIIAGISPSGLVSSTKIKTSSGSGTLDNAAIRAIRDWRFTPATNNGRPITSEVEIPLTFKIK